MRSRFEEPYSAVDVIKCIELPKVRRDIPVLVLVVGPARSGTTALFLALASNGRVDRCYYQPLKSLMRFGFPRLTVNPADSTILMKETFWAAHSQVPRFDPLTVLCKAGYPVSKIRPIFIFRDPVSTFASWRRQEDVPPHVFSEQYGHCLQTWRDCQEIHDLKLMTLVYEAFDQSEIEVMATIVHWLGLKVSAKIKFDAQAIERKVVWGQGSDTAYFERLIRPILNRGRMLYVRPKSSLSEAEMEKIREACLPGYIEVRRNFTLHQ